jgi:hypothetical protein
MAEFLFNQKKAREDLKKFFEDQKDEINDFGSKVNQTFEAFIFALVINFYKKEGWKVEIINPEGKSEFRLKFNTNGTPKNYSYIKCSKKDKICLIRHQQRAFTYSYSSKNKEKANICCDIVVFEDVDLSNYKSSDAIPNENLISFGEVKHMSAFAELLASFIGLVHELKPEKIKKIRDSSWKRNDHISPFLYASGFLNPTAKGIKETIQNRKYDFDIYSIEYPMDGSDNFTAHEKKKKEKKNKKKKVLSTSPIDDLLPF